MRRFFLYIIICCIIFPGCEDRLLNQVPDNSLTTSEALKDYEALTNALNGCYDGLQEPSYYGRDMIVIADLYADNAKLSSSSTGTFNSIYNINLVESDDIATELWDACYDVINRTNNIIAATDSVSDADQEEINQIEGEARAIRALTYFDLLRVFAQTYALPSGSGIDGANGAGGHLGVPLVTEPADPSSTPSRATVKKVTDFIIDELLNADTLISVEFSTPFTFSQMAVKALLSKIYLFKKDYVNAIYAGGDVIFSEIFELVQNEEYLDSWEEKYTSESIFSIAMTANDYNNTASIGYLFSSSGYNEVVPTTDLTSIFTDYNDIRKELYVAGSEIYKYPGREGQTGLDNIPVIRLADIYLTYAEAWCRIGLSAGNSSYFENARVVLDEIRFRANSDSISVDADDDELLDEILAERRRELAFEADRLFSIKQNMGDLERDDCEASVCEVDFPDDRFAFPIPEDEMNANDSITQNPGY